MQVHYIHCYEVELMGLFASRGIREARCGAAWMISKFDSGRDTNKGRSRFLNYIQFLFSSWYSRYLQVSLRLLVFPPQLRAHS